jgi:predicted small secreted protein
LETEKWMVYDETQRCFGEDVFGGHILFNQFEKMLSDIQREEEPIQQFWRNLFYFVFLQPDKKETLQEVNKIYSYYDSISNQSPAERKNIIKDPFEYEVKHNLFINMLYPSFNKILNMSFKNKANVDAASTIISILRFKQDKNTYPENLQELIDQNYLKQMPIDPFSNKPMIYKKADNNFILYSKGEDFIDNGGERKNMDSEPYHIWSETGDAVFWPVKQ